MTAEDWNRAAPVLREWKKRARVASNAHRLALRRCSQAHNRIGILLVCLSALLASSLFSTYGQVLETAKIALGVVVALLGAIQTFQRFDQKAQAHESLRTAYAAVCREIEETLCLGVEKRGDVQAFLMRIRYRLDDLSRANSPVPEDLYQKALSEYEEEPNKAPEPTPVICHASC